MPFLTMIFTVPFLCIAYKKEQVNEKMYFLKLLLLWFLCQLYILLNSTYRLPIGLIVALIVALNDTTNKKAKITAFIIGCIGFVSSSLVFILSI
jgi:hypothetical protein